MKSLFIVVALFAGAMVARAQCGSSGKLIFNPLTGLPDCTGSGGGSGSGTVTSVSVTTANGVSGSVATATTTPAITLTFGAITPSSVTASSLAGSGTRCISANNAGLLGLAAAGCGGGSPSPYTLCASGCSTTIPASPFSVTAATHGQGVYPYIFAYNSSLNPVSITWTIDTSGNITGITYTGSLGLVVIASGSGTAGAAGAAGANGVASSISVNGSNITTQSAPNFLNSAATTGLTLSFSNPSAGGIQLGLSGVLTSAGGGSGVANTATHTLGSSNQNWATLGTGIVKNTTTTGAISDAASADVYGLWSGTCNSTTFLRGDGACAAPSGTGTVTSVGWTGGLVSVATPTSTPAFTVAGTSGGLPYFSSASTWASSSAGTQNNAVLWGGAGNAPVDSGLLFSTACGAFQCATGTLSSAQLLSLSGTPITVIPAVSGGIAIVDEVIVNLIAGGTPYTFSGTLAIKDGGSHTLTGTCASAILTSASNSICEVLTVAVGAVASSGFINQPIQITISSAATLGTGTLAYWIKYHVVTTVQ